MERGLDWLYVKIIEDHNGEIQLLDSTSLGGALVRIKLYENFKNL